MSLDIEPVEVFRGRHDPALFGPLPGVQQGNVVAYEFELPNEFEPWPGRTLVERTFVLLDLGVSCSQPCWVRQRRPDGSVVDRSAEGNDSWYVELITAAQEGGRYTFRDLYIDVIVPMDGRHHRMLDLDEFADAFEAQLFSREQAIDALRRWQWFLDRHLHGSRAPAGAWTDFPPAAIEPLRSLPPFGEAVRWNR